MNYYYKHTSINSQETNVIYITLLLKKGHIMKKRLGVIIDTLDGQYQKEVGNGLIKEAAIHDVQLFFFSSQVLHSRLIINHEYDSVFDLPTADTLDGLFLIISSLKNVYGETWTSNLLKQYKSLPLVSLSIPFKEAITISHFNEQGMKDIINHVLIHVPLNEIAYVSGPTSNAEALMRLKAFKSFFNGEEYTLNPSNFYEGNFLGHSGGNAVDYFIQNNDSLPKAIVCANDEMAIGVFRRLKELGYSVPKDVLLTGYDNINMARDMFPSLTTYDQDFHKLYKLSMDEMIAYIKGDRTPSTKLSVGRLIVRESCGCSPLPVSLRENTSHQLNIQVGDYESCLEHFETFAKTQYIKIIDLLNKHLYLYNHIISNDHDISLLLTNGLINDLKNESVDGAFIHELIKLLRYELKDNDNPLYLQEFIQDLKVFWISHIDNAKLIIHIQDIFYNAMTVIEENFRRRQSQEQFKFSRMYLMSRELVLSLNASSSVEETCEVLFKELPVYNISQFYLCLFDDINKNTGTDPSVLPEYCQLIMGYNKGQRIEHKQFKTLDLLPESILTDSRKSNFLFLSLFSGYEQYGYIVFSLDGIDFIIYETLRAHISEALKRHSITKLRMKAEASLKDVMLELEMSNKLLTKQSINDELTGIYNRRGFFITSENYYNEAKNSEKSFYVIFGDIDGLKYINDNFGHKEGDFAIKKITELINKVLDQQHIFARMSGDEFIILVKDVEDQTTINALLKFIQQQLLSYNSLKEKAYDLNISFGFAKFNSDTCDSLDQLILQADKNLYVEKNKKKY